LVLPSALQGMQVLVIDDNENLCTVVRRMLETFGAKAKTVLSGEAALELLRQPGQPLVPDLVIVDLMMPGIDGIRTAEAIRLLSGDRRLPILMISGIGNEQILQDSGSSVIGGFLHKPFTRGRLFHAVLNLMGQGVADDETIVPGMQIAKGVGPETFAGLLVLVVEDNVINQQVAREILENGGFRVDIADNGYEALARLRQHRYDAVLMDVQMPEMDGFETTRRIRRELGEGKLPIIAMTAHAVKGYREKCLAAGMNDYVPKPIEMDLLFDVLRRWVMPEVGNKPASSPAVASETDDEAGRLVTLLRPFSGLDVPKALARLGGNAMIYQVLLADFAREYDQGAARYQALIEQGAYQDAERFAHTIKGLAGNCGAGPLSALALDLEVAARERRCDGLADKYASFESALDEVLAAAALLGRENVAPHAPAQEGRDRAELVVALYVRVLEQNVAAEDVFHALQEHLTDEPGRAARAELELQLGLFDFEAARKTVAELARHWNVVLPRSTVG
jgi:CheY-like chemotaxis protein